MKTRSLLEQLIRKMIFEQSDTKTGFIKQKPKTVKSQPVADNPEVRKVSIKPGSDTAVLDGWKHGAARVGNARTTFEVKVANRGKGEVDSISDQVIGVISTSREYGMNSRYAKVNSADTPTNKKYAYVIGDNVSKLPRHGKFNVWVVNLEILYKIANQIDSKLGLGDAAVSGLENYGPSHIFPNSVPIYNISVFERLVNSIKSYMRDPKIGGSLIIPTAGVEFNKSNNEITVTDEKVFPDLTGLDKEYIESNIDTTPQNQTFEKGDGSLSGFLNFVGDGQVIYSSTGESKFIPTKGSIDIFRQKDDAVGKFEGTFKKGFPDTGTLTWSDMTPYTGIIQNDAIKQILIPNPDQSGANRSSNVISFSIRYNADKLKSGEEASTEVISNKTTESEIKYPYTWKSDAGDFIVIKLESKPTIVFYKDDKRWMYINQQIFEDAINSEGVVEIIPQRVTDKGLIAELETELTSPTTSEPTQTIEPGTTSEIEFPYYETSNGGFTVITLSSTDPYVYYKDSQNKWYTIKKETFINNFGRANTWNLISNTGAIAKLDKAKDNTTNFKVAVNNKTVTPKPAAATQTQVYLKNSNPVGVTIKRFIYNTRMSNVAQDSKYTTKQNDKFYKTATKNIIIAGETYMNVKFPDGKTYWVYADSFK
jgi:hypothetical protein